MKIVLIIIIILFFFLAVRYLEKKNLYYPFRAIEATPEDIRLKYEDVYVTTEDGVRLFAWFIPSEEPRATLMFCHGNGGNISHRLDKIKIFNDLFLDVFIFDYRGYGMSKGKPSEQGLYLDAEAVYDYLLNNKKIPPQKLIVYGESLGGAVTVELAGRHKVGGIIIENTFTSVKDMAKRIFPFIPAFIYANKFDSL
ncbi:MAG: alpha/beta fold hydrolase, partial [Nitrospirota bacterium]